MCPRRILLPVATIGLFSSCGGSDDNCPGLCPDETVQPIMTISTDDGSASIASAKILSGACVHLLLHSSGQDGAPTHYAAVQVTYGGPRDSSAVCQVELTSRFGQRAVVAAPVASRAYQQTCCPYGTCCPAASTVTQHHHAEFVPPTQTVSFPPSPDAGPGDGATDAAADAPDAAADAAGDGPKQPGEIDANPSLVDLAGGDSPGLESRELDGAMVDLPSLESRLLDGATADGPEPFDLASGS